jgi:hypothetical protein
MKMHLDFILKIFYVQYFDIKRLDIVMIVEQTMVSFLFALQPHDFPKLAAIDIQDMAGNTSTQRLAS